jgi:macrolide phosphotransferase
LLHQHLLRPSTKIRTADDFVPIAREHGIRVRPDRLELDASGADFLVAHAVDEEDVRWVLRAARRADVVERAALEARALRLVEGRIPAAVPRWEVFTPELIAYRRLPGHPAAIVDTAAGGYVWRFDDHAPPDRYLHSLARTLAALHGIPASEATAAGLPVRRTDEVRSAFEVRIERAREVLVIPDAVLRRWRNWLEDDTFWPERTRLIHGDVHPPHVLVDDGFRVSGLLDWTEAQVGDPATDFIIHYATLGRDALSELLVRYRGAGGEVWQRMEEHVAESWSAYPVVIAEFALRSGDSGPRRLAQYLVDDGAWALARG